METLNKYALIAPCGMNCGVCMAYLREKNHCPGCREADVNKAVSVIRCKIKNCDALRKGKLKYCFDCEDYPCDILKHLDKRYRTRYHLSEIENLEFIRDRGIRKFLKFEEKRWTCLRCGGTIRVHGGYCVECGKKK